TYIRDTGRDNGTSEFIDIRGRFDFHGYFRFDLPNDIRDVVSASVLFERLDDAASRNEVWNNDRFRLWGLEDVAGNTPQDWIESGAGELDAVTAGAEDRTTGDGLVNLDGSAQIIENISGNIATVSGDPVTAFIQQRAEDSGLITFIVDFFDLASDRGYGIASKENTSGAMLPTLTLEYVAVPEPSAAALFFGLAGISLAVLRRRRPLN
ncbi:MAG: PEP-CTERM sorting domain-containing protein, partial [Opitutales bacterium]